MREVAEVHRDLFRDQAYRYGENVRIKIERCLAVTDEELEEGPARARPTASSASSGSRESTCC